VATVSTLNDARAAKAKVARLLGGHPQVNGIGIARSDSGYEIKINLSAPLKERLPTSLDGVPIKAEVVGRISRRIPA
jgi:hypothetical protein